MTRRYSPGRRSNDFPDTDSFPLSVLNAAYDYYMELTRTPDVNIYNMFQIKFNMPPSKVAILVSAAKFKHEMKKKGVL